MRGEGRGPLRQTLPECSPAIDGLRHTLPDCSPAIDGLRQRLPGPLGPAPPPPSFEPPPAPSPVPVRLTLPPLHSAVDAAALLRSGIAPPTILGGAVGVTVASAAPGFVAPELGVAFSAATTGPFDSPTAVATYKLVAAQLTACPVRVVRSARLSVYPCLATDLGVILGAGESAAVPTHSRAAPFWADLTPGLRAVLPVAGPFFARLDAGAAVSLVRPTFVFEDPSRHLDTVAAVGFVGSVGLGASLW